MSKKSPEDAVELMVCSEVETEEVKGNQQQHHSIKITVEPSSNQAPSQDVSSKDGEISEKSKRKLSPDPHGQMDCDCSDVFIQLMELGSNGLFWREKARWIKYEENVEPSGNWGRPFLPYIDCESLRQFGHYLENGLVMLGSENNGAYNFSHTISSMLVLGGYAEPQYRARIQQILTLPRMHQGESTARFRKKVHLRRKCLTMAAQKRREVMARAWDLSENEVRNRWVRLAPEALNRHRRLNPDAQKIKEHLSSRENCPEKYLFNENGQLEATTESNLLISHPTFDRTSVVSEFSDASFLVNGDFDALEERGLPMTREQTKLRKIIHRNSKGILILHASVDFLKRDKFLSALVRFKNDKPLVDSLEISLPIRFVYLLITSKHSVRMDGFQICRSVATLFKDKAFLRYALQAKTLADLTNAWVLFIDGSVMLPPGNWQPELLVPVAESISKITRKKHRMRKFRHRDGKHLWRIVRTKIFVISMMKGLVHTSELKDDGYVETEVAQHEETMTPTYFPRRGDCPVKTKLCKLRRRFMSSKTKVKTDDSQNSDSSVSDDEEGSNEIHPLQPDGRWFGGLRRELAKRYPIYWIDIKDGLSIQCVASLFYLAISLTAMCLTYGQVIAKYTKGYMGASEMLLATAISCCVMAVFATEPLSVIAGTAAMLIFESSAYQASDMMGLHFLQYRWITGIWIFLFLLLILAFDKTHWIHYCTRFTEEILHVLVALLFMYEGIKNIVHVYEEHPLRKDYVTINSTGQNSAEKPNTALLYTIVMFATFGIALGFRLFEKTRFFSPRIRRLLNFFSIAVAVNVMNLMMYFVDVYLNTIHIPERLQLTSPQKRDRFVFLDVDKISEGLLSYWIILVSAIPALLTVILLFIESEVTLLECFKETNGRKGSGFHVNLLIVAVMVLVSSFLGLPWMCLAAVETSVHLDSLKVWSSFDAPGVKSHVVKIREQRLTLFFTGILVGLTGFLNSYLDHIPEAVFSGMVLYMGVVALFGVQLVERFFLMFMAPGQHPDIPYLKNVPLFKVYSFTVIQIICVVVLWIVKSFKAVSPFFPLVVLLMIPLRALLGKAFSVKHIEQLDNEEEEEGRGPLD